MKQMYKNISIIIKSGQRRHRNRQNLDNRRSSGAATSRMIGDCILPDLVRDISESRIETRSGNNHILNHAGLAPAVIYENECNWISTECQDSRQSNDSAFFEESPNTSDADTDKVTSAFPGNGGVTQDAEGHAHLDIVPQSPALRDPQIDLDIIKKANVKLKLSGFYFPNMTMQEAKEKLRKTTEGTFLLRDSSHREYIFSLSTKTKRGTTSVRVEYRDGYFRLDCDEKDIKKMPKFDCPCKMLEFYVRASKKGDSKCVWLESSGRRDTPVILRKAYRAQPLDLKSLCRQKILHQVKPRNIKTLPLSQEDIRFLEEFPHCL